MNSLLTYEATKAMQLEMRQRADLARRTQKTNEEQPSRRTRVVRTLRFGHRARTA